MNGSENISIDNKDSYLWKNKPLDFLDENDINDILNFNFQLDFRQENYIIEKIITNYPDIVVDFDDEFYSLFKGLEDEIITSLNNVASCTRNYNTESILFKWCDYENDIKILKYKPLYRKYHGLEDLWYLKYSKSEYLVEKGQEIIFRTLWLGEAVVTIPTTGVLKFSNNFIPLDKNIDESPAKLKNNVDVLYIDYSECSIEKIKQEIKRKEEKIERLKTEHEKERIRQKLLQKKRKKELEKEVINELLDSGELFPESSKRPPVPKEVADTVWNRDQGRCVYCGSTINLHFDHIIPFSKGGSTNVENLQILCEKCNHEKSNKIG